MGGSDPHNTTLKVLRALERLRCRPLQVCAVVGASNPHQPSLQQEIERLGPEFQLARNADIPALMAWADLAVAAGGITSWELAFMGLPSAVIVLADNQRPVACALGEAGVALNLGGHEELAPQTIAPALESLALSPTEREAMSAKARMLVDGQGARRVANLLAGPWLHLRPAGESDSRLVWEWANDPVTRAASFCSDPIPWETHAQWFLGKLQDPDCLHYLATDEEDNPVGQVRFDLNGAEATVSISVAPSLRGRGYGEALLRQGCEQLFQDSRVRLIHACIKPENTASLRIFAKGGFTRTALAVIKGQDAVHCVLPKGGERL
jgi:RimJ/RimL family protein N-acetyltransferase